MLSISLQERNSKWQFFLHTAWKSETILVSQFLWYLHSIDTASSSESWAKWVSMLIMSLGAQRRNKEVITFPGFSGNETHFWRCAALYQIYHENELCSEMRRINFLMKILYWFPQSRIPDKCHQAMSLPVNQH